jgi:hypothetical protein
LTSSTGGVSSPTAPFITYAAGGQVKPHAQPNLLRAHGAILTTLIGLTASDSDEAMDALLEALRSPLCDAPMGDAREDGPWSLEP